MEFLTVRGDEARTMDASMEWPDDAWVVFAMEDGEIIARSSILHLPMVEATFVRPDKRSGTLAVRLLKKVEEVYLENQKPVAFAFTLDSQPDIGDYLLRFGFEKMNTTMYMKRLIGEEQEAP